jgi:galactokinase/mevalonate kinase-like predicted kinase
MGQVLLSVPPHLRDFLQSAAGREIWGRRLAEAAGGNALFVGTDPKARRLGSGGGTVHLLHQAWSSFARPDGRATEDAFSASRKKHPPQDIFEWLGASQRLVLHAGGESRRLPAYAALGKAFLPLPPVEGLAPRRFDQMLVDFQVPAYWQVLEEAGARARVLVTSGDVWLDFDPLQIAPVEADITGIGMRVSPEVAQHFGVYFVAKEHDRSEAGGRPISFFLQKPAPETIYRHAARHDFFVDTGMWLLSLPALRLLFRRCGWDEKAGRFETADGHARHLDLYTEIGSALGTEAEVPGALRRLGWSRLAAAVIPLDDARFHHLGSSRQLFESFEQIQRGQFSPQRALCAATPASAFRRRNTLPVWLDGAGTRPPIELEGYNIVTGLPSKAPLRSLAQGWCLEAAPVGDNRWILRPYHLDDTLRGRPGAGTVICGRDAAAWLDARPAFTEVSAGKPSEALAKDGDVFDLPIYPVLAEEEMTDEIVAWFFSEEPDRRITAELAAQPRLSAAGIPGAIDFGRLFAGRRRAEAETLLADFQACRERGDTRVLAQDFKAVADFCRRSARELKEWIARNRRGLLAQISRPEQAARLLSLLDELDAGPKRGEKSRRRLQESLIASQRLAPATPRRSLKDDQIVWARSPARLDLAGGWTDTPPYCLEQGGAVLNVAVLLNGQPPIQAFVRPIKELCFRFRSIDLGSAEEAATFAALESFRDPRSGFSLPKAALALAGFLPDFAAGKPARSLSDQLRALGGGFEISLLSAVPKGSGLGTSSILGATILGALNLACGLGWDEVDLYQRVLGIEQLLTTGGGWQDQAGALFRGVKLVQTQPGSAQTPAVRYLPDHLLGAGAANQSLLLYYTGVTRLAKGILQEIVHDMFLGRAATLRALDLIRSNAFRLHHAMQGNDDAELHRCIARSWKLNCRLDAGVTTPAIERILARCGPDLAAAKLLGAGGGGYMLLCARDAEAGRLIREKLESRPPNPRARFIDFAVAERGMEVTVS